jgi:transcriptional regulator GlxA family with amidase domain
MKHLSILVPEGDINLSSIIGSYKIFTRVNDQLVKTGREPAFIVQLVGNSKKRILYNGLFSIQPDIKYNRVLKTDLVIIPAIQTDTDNIKRNNIFIPWLVAQRKHGAELASVCTGAFLLASTGLLDGKTCSTHWMESKNFKRHFPKVNLVTEKLITDEDGIYTNGGAFSFLQLLIYLVEKFCGREIAIECSKIFEIDLDRNSQSPYSIFIGQKNHVDETIKMAQHYIENNIKLKTSVEDIAHKFGLGKRNFERRFKTATSNTPIEYIQRVMVEYAKKKLETGTENVNEVMYEVGYSDRKAFRTVFKKFSGLLPLEYRLKYNKEASRRPILK